MIYEAYKPQGKPTEEGRRGNGVSTVSYPDGKRPGWLNGYEIVFIGNPYEHMEWLRKNRHLFPCLKGADLDGMVGPKKSRPWWRWALAAAAGSAALAALHHFIA